jgi:hypothetical protein
MEHHGMHLVPKAEYPPRCLEVARNIWIAYVLNTLDPERNEIDDSELVLTQKNIIEKFKNQTSLEDMQDLAEQILGQNIPEEAKEMIKKEASKI